VSARTATTRSSRAGDRRLLPRSHRRLRRRAGRRARPPSRSSAHLTPGLLHELGGVLVARATRTRPVARRGPEVGGSREAWWPSADRVGRVRSQRAAADRRAGGVGLQRESGGQRAGRLAALRPGRTRRRRTGRRRRPAPTGPGPEVRPIPRSRSRPGVGGGRPGPSSRWSSVATPPPPVAALGHVAGARVRSSGGRHPNGSHLEWCRFGAMVLVRSDSAIRPTMASSERRGPHGPRTPPGRGRRRSQPRRPPNRPADGGDGSGRSATGGLVEREPTGHHVGQARHGVHRWSPIPAGTARSPPRPAPLAAPALTPPTPPGAPSHRTCSQIGRFGAVLTRKFGEVGSGRARSRSPLPTCSRSGRSGGF